jgi:hypothetical protein
MIKTNCTIYVVNAYSFSINLGARQINLAPGLNNIDSALFNELISHPDVEMYESLGWIQIFDGTKEGTADSKSGLVLADAAGDEGLPIADVNPDTGNAKVKKSPVAKQPKA